MKENEKQVGITLGEDILRVIQEEADQQERSLSAQVRFILKEWVENLIEYKKGEVNDELHHLQ